MSPLASTRVLHPRVSEHHRRPVAGFATATCVITTATGGTWTPDQGITPGAATTVYTGPCRVAALDQAPGEGDAAGQTVTEHPYLVEIPDVTAPVVAGARVKVTACPDDPLLVEKTLTVADVPFASAPLFARELLCDLDPGNQPAA